MMAWLASRTPRERWTLALGGIALAAGIGNWLVLQPVESRTAQLRNRVQDQQALFAWLQQVAPEATRLRRIDATPAQKAAPASLLTVVDQSTRRAGLKKAVKRVAPESSSKVRLWLEGVSFDTLIAWLARLEARHGVETEAVSVERDAKPGLVRASMTLRIGTSPQTP